MSSTVSREQASSLLPARIYARPYLGLLAFAGVILWKPVAHSISVLLSTGFPGDAGYVVGSLIGLVGATIIWKGLRRNELTATCLGFIGGALIWVGWFEYAFDFFAETLHVAPLMYEGKQAISPNLLVLQSTAIPVLALLYLLLIANKDTQCRLALWLRKNLHLKAETATPGYKRSYARITALEVIFINWFMYLINITLNDSRVFGTEHPAQYVVFVAFIAWAGYLLILKVPKLREMPLAIRYSIGVAGPAWSAIEIASRLELYKEIWIYPFQFPVSMVAITAVFLSIAAAIFVTPKLVSTGQASSVAS